VLFWSKYQNRGEIGIAKKRPQAGNNITEVYIAHFVSNNNFMLFKSRPARERCINYIVEFIGVLERKA
jgi:hypothetical protein